MGKQWRWVNKLEFVAYKYHSWVEKVYAFGWNSHLSKKGSDFKENVIYKQEGFRSFLLYYKSKNTYVIKGA